MLLSVSSQSLDTLHTGHFAYWTTHLLVILPTRHFTYVWNISPTEQFVYYLDILPTYLVSEMSK